MALCVSLLLWLLSTIHVSLAADDEVAAPAPDSDPDPAPVVTVGNALTVKLHEDELTKKENKQSHRLDPLQHLQDYETAGKLVDEHPKAVRIADKEIKNPLGNFHVHLWAHLGSLPPAFCIPLEKEIPELPPKPLLKALEEVLSSLVNETAADPQIQEKVIEIIKPFEKFRNCCDKYFVFIDVKVPEFKPSEKSLYIWSKIAGHGVAGAPAVEPAAIEAPQDPEPAVKEPAPAEEAQEGAEGGGSEEQGAGRADTEKDKGEQAAEAEQAQQPQGKAEEQGAPTTEQQQARPAKEEEKDEDEAGGGAQGGKGAAGGAEADGENEPKDIQFAPVNLIDNEEYTCEMLTEADWNKLPRNQDGDVDFDAFAKEVEKLCRGPVDHGIVERVFKSIDTDGSKGISFREMLKFRGKTTQQQATEARALSEEAGAGEPAA